MEHSGILHYQLRFNCKTATTDSLNPGIGWAKARKAQCEQILFQLSLGEFPPHVLQRRKIPILLDGDTFSLPLLVHGIVIRDEHYKIVSWASESTKPTHPLKGMPPQRHLTMTTMFALEARGSFGIAVRINPDGSLTGVKADKKSGGKSC